MILDIHGLRFCSLHVIHRHGSSLMGNVKTEIPGKNVGSVVYS